MIFLVCLTAFILPLILIPVERIAPYPYVIEEIAKAILILQILKLSKRKNQLIVTLIAAFLFAFSENMFYLTNLITGGAVVNSFLQRFLLTTSIHSLTAVIILLPAQKKRKLIVPATILAIIIHYLYNQLVLFIF